MCCRGHIDSDISHKDRTEIILQLSLHHSALRFMCFVFSGDLAMLKGRLREGVTFDDVLLIPAKSEVLLLWTSARSSPLTSA